MAIKNLRVVSLVFFSSILFFVQAGVFTFLEGRSYQRENTWNGCVSFGHDHGNTFRTWECPESELNDVVHVAKWYVRYECNYEQ